MYSLSASPYVPGQARGILRFGPASAAADVIVALRQHEVSALCARPAGIILIDVSPLSHPTLRLLSQEIPVVLVEEAQLQGMIEGDEIFLDGQSGLLTSPIPAKPADYVEPSPPEAGKAILSEDAVAVDLRASIGSIEASSSALNHGATSIGLMRSEYLFPEDGSPPDVDFLAAAFEQICQAAQPLPVTFRLVDIAGDKRPPWLGEISGVTGVLGLQGSRLYATEPVRQVYLNELKALSRLVGQYHFSVLLPYVTTLEELKSLIAEIRRHLPSTVRIGVMLETPAAALSVQEFLSIADFAALGCNDLMQCLFAADRDLSELRNWLNPYAPALYRFLNFVAQLAGSAVDEIQVCGLLPQYPYTLPVLLGMGYRAFSVDPIMIPWLGQTVRKTDSRLAVQLAKTVCQSNQSTEVKKLLLEANNL